MKKECLLLLLFSIGFASMGLCKTNKFRSGIFLHHSTGECIWGPNGSTTSVPKEMAKYNAAKGLSGDDGVSMDERWWPSEDNEWVTWHNIFYNKDPNNDITPILQNNRIIVIKSCFPSSNIEAVGTPGDTLYPDYKTIHNYKWHWRSIARVMAEHPENFFVIWTNAPLVANETDQQQAELSDQFCRWAKDTLATGADPLFGTFPSNVYIFDFFHKLVDANGMLPAQYASGEWDSHPNAAATQLVAPQFVQEIFDAAIAYETISGVRCTSSQSPSTFVLQQNYPNPFNSITRIAFRVPRTTKVVLKVYDARGREMATLLAEVKPKGAYEVTFVANDFPSGLYVCKMQVGEFVKTRKAVLVR